MLLCGPSTRNMKSARRGQAIAASSAITLLRGVAAEIFNKAQPDGAKIMSELRWGKAREPGFCRYDCFLDSSQVVRLIVRTQLPFVDVGKDQLAPSRRTACDATESRNIRLTCQVLRNAEPGEECKLRRAETRARQS